MPTPKGARSGTKPKDRPDTGKAPRTLNLSVGLVERMQDAVYWTPGLTMAGLAEEAIERELARLTRKRGEPFPRRERNPQRGRPIGS